MCRRPAHRQPVAVGIHSGARVAQASREHQVPASRRQTDLLRASGPRERSAQALLTVVNLRLYAGRAGGRIRPYASLGNGSGTKVAVIEAGDLSAAATDVATYRTQFGLGTASFFKYNETGQQSNYPPSCQNYGWCGETALDIDMVSASCPKCTIYLMEAKDGSSISDFETAEQEAVTLGATIVSNSWSCPNNWDCGDPNFGSYFNTPHIAYLASTGDSGYNTIGGPSALGSVIGVGGTPLTKSGSTYSERIWSGASAGASTAVVGSPGVPKPSWQTDTGCTNRTDGDVSSESGCSPGVAVYISMYGGWSEYCGTSVASPFLAGVIGLKGNAARQDGGKRFWKLRDGKKVNHQLHYISSGNDGSCGGTYLCTAGTNQYETYSGPGGFGSPRESTRSKTLDSKQRGGGCDSTRLLC